MPDTASSPQLLEAPDVIINPYRFSGGGGAPAPPNVGLASREFDGVDDYVDCGSPSDIASLDVLSLSAWVKLADYSGSGNTYMGTVIEYAGGITKGVGLRIGNGQAADEDIVQFYVAVSGSWYIAETSQGAISLGAWYHLSGTYDGTTLRLYIDGVEVDSVSAAGVISDPEGSLYIGKSNELDGRHLDGNLADVRIYNRALSSSEISDLHAGTEVSSGLVGHYLGQADTVNDLAGTNHGTDNGSIYIPSGPLGVALTPTFGYNSYEFDGVDDYLIVADSPAFDFSSGITLAAWVKCSGLTSNNGIFGKSTDVQFRLINGTVARCQLSNGVDVRGTTDILNSGQWHHVVMTWDLSTARFYTDANEEDTQAIATAFNKGATEWHIGEYSSQEWDGNLADVRIYNRALTSGEVAALATGSPSATTDGLVGHWLTDYQHLTNTIVDFSGGTPPEDGTNNGAVYSLDGPLDLIDPPTFGNVGLEFDGVDDYIGVANFGAVGLDDFSMAAWVKFDAAENNFTRVFDTGDFALMVKGTDGQIRLDFDGFNTPIGAPDSGDGSWHHWAITVDRDGDALFYVDGAQVGSGIDQSGESTNSLTGSADGKIGARDSSSNYFNGALADVRIYNRALSSTEVEQLSQGINVTSGIKGWWLTDTADTLPAIVDHSGWDNTGTATGTTASDGPFFSREFDGVDDYVDCGGAASGITSAFSLSAWAKFSSLALYDSIVSQSSAPALVDGFGFYIYGSDTVGFWVNHWNLNKVTHLLTNPTGQWYHLTGTWDGATMEFFVDGTSVGTEAESGALSLVGSLELGRGFDDAYNLDGNLADVRIYNRALTASEVTDLYNGDAVDNTGLEGHWLSGDNWDYNTVTDASGNGNHGTNVGSIASTEKFVHPADPDEVSGLELWLDASDASTLYDATTGGSLVLDDGPIARWEDKSGNANHATQGTGADQPARRVAEVNGLDVVDFDTGDVLSFTEINETAGTMFVVFQRNSSGIISPALSGPNTSQYALFWFSNNTVYTAFGAANYGYDSTDTGENIFSVAHTAGGGNPTVWRNGAEITLDQGTTSGNVILDRVGEQATRGGVGAFCEAIVYNRALSDEERISIERGLALKWGISYGS